jgi:ATP-dependent 26S proteasome regulatory subunit
MDAHQIVKKALGHNQKLIAAKVVQLIVAQKIRQVDLEKLEQDVSVAITKEGFNIFSFTQNYF